MTCNDVFMKHNTIDVFERLMNDKNIITFQNAIVYRDYKIYHNDSLWGGEYQFVHDSYDGADDAHDKRFGFSYSIEACVFLINQQIKESEL